MRRLAAILAASLALNLALLAAFVAWPRLAPPAIRTLLRVEPTISSALATGRGARHATAPAAPPVSWSAFATDDLPTLVRRLRAAGVPADLVRAIIMAELDARFAPRIRALVAPADTPFWQRESSSVWTNPAKREELNQLYRERAQLLRALIGTDVFAAAGQDPDAETQRQYGNVSAEKIALLERINDDYAEMTARIRARMQDIVLPEDRAELELLERERRADLAALLTPQELADYDLHASRTLGRLRGALTAMDASEEEFRTLYAIARPFEDRLYSASSETSRPSAPERRAALLEMAGQLESALGAQRYGDFLRGTSPEYQQLRRLAEDNGLPGDVAARAFAVRTDVSQQSRRIIADASLDAAQKRAALRDLAQSARAQLLTTLGPAAGNTFLQRTTWLDIVARGNAMTFLPDNSTVVTPVRSAPRRP